MTTPKTVGLSPELHAYLVEHGSPPDETQRALIEETAALGGVSIMQVAPEQGAFLEMLVRVTGAKRLVEVGTFTGYSALCLARGLPEGGSLLCCDVSEEWTEIAQRHWQAAGVADRIELRIAPALETLKVMNAWPCHYAYNQFDGNMLIGSWPGGPENMLMATGFSGHGLQHAPAAGRALSELKIGRAHV